MLAPGGSKVAAAMPPSIAESLTLEESQEMRRARGVEITRPFPNIIKVSHAVGWLLVVVGISEVIVGCILFKDWEVVGGFWVGFMAWVAGVIGTCVSPSENSGGFPTALFFLQSALCIVAASLSLTLIEGSALQSIRDTSGNCFSTESCPNNVCGGYDCVCWKDDGSSDCGEGSKHRICLLYNGGRSCDGIRNSENLLLTSTVLHFIIIGLAATAILAAIATCCCCKYTVLLRRENGVTLVHRV